MIQNLIARSGRYLQGALLSRFLVHTLQHFAVDSQSQDVRGHPVIVGDGVLLDLGPGLRVARNAGSRRLTPLVGRRRGRVVPVVQHGRPRAFRTSDAAPSRGRVGMREGAVRRAATGWDRAGLWALGSGLGGRCCRSEHSLCDQLIS